MVKKEVRDAIIKTGKEKYKGELFLAEYTIIDRDGRPMELLFTYREPTGAEMVVYQNMAARDAMGANRWMMGEVIVSSEEDVMERIGNHHTAVLTFITDYFNPLFGELSEKKPIRRV